MLGQVFHPKRRGVLQAARRRSQGQPNWLPRYANLRGSVQPARPSIACPRQARPLDCQGWTG